MPHQAADADRAETQQGEGADDEQGDLQRSLGWRRGGASFEVGIEAGGEIADERFQVEVRDEIGVGRGHRPAQQRRRFMRWNSYARARLDRAARQVAANSEIPAI